MALWDGFPWTNLHEKNLDWVLKTVKDVYVEWDEMKQQWTTYQNTMNTKFAALEKVQQSQWDLINSTWREMLDKLVTSVIPQLITFGLTDDGYFFAAIPPQWSNMLFYTDTSDFNAYPFGRLQLSYEIPFS